MDSLLRTQEDYIDIAETCGLVLKEINGDGQPVFSGTEGQWTKFADMGLKSPFTDEEPLDYEE